MTRTAAVGNQCVCSAALRGDLSIGICYCAAPSNGTDKGAGVDVARWLQEIGLPQYVEAFRANNIDEHVLRLLADDDLKQLGVGSLGTTEEDYLCNRFFGSTS